MGRILRIAQGNMGKSQVGGRCFIDMLYIRMQLRNNIYIYMYFQKYTCTKFIHTNI